MLSTTLPVLHLTKHIVNEETKFVLNFSTLISPIFFENKVLLETILRSHEFMWIPCAKCTVSSMGNDPKQRAGECPM